MRFIYCFLYFLAISPFLSYGQGGGGEVFLRPGPDCGKDALVWNAPGFNNANINYGDDPSIGAHAWTNTGIPDTGRSLIEFELDQIPVGALITSAYLSLYNDSSLAYCYGSHASLSGPNTGRIRRVISPWNEHLVKWFTQPSTTALHEVIVPATAGPHSNYQSIDVTALVQDMVNDPDSSFGFMLSLEDETYYRALTFASSDDVNPSMRPSLLIIYQIPASGCFRLQAMNECGIDALVWNAPGFSNGTTNYGSADCIGAHAWTNSGIPDTGRSLLNFDIDLIPTNAAVVSAGLSLYSNPGTAYAGGQHSSFSWPNAGVIRRITSPWREDSVIWFTQPTFTFVNEVVLPPSIGPYDDYLNMDVTQLVQDMIQNSQSSYGFEFALLDEHYYSSLVFTSSDAADPSRYPKLEICYSITNGLQPMNSNATEPRVFPNPVGDRAQLSYDPTVYSDAVLQQLTLQGQVIRNLGITTQTGYAELDLTDLSSGVYMLRIQCTGAVKSLPVIKR